MKLSESNYGSLTTLESYFYKKECDSVIYKVVVINKQYKDFNTDGKFQTFLAYMYDNYKAIFCGYSHVNSTVIFLEQYKEEFILFLLEHGEIVLEIMDL